TGGKQEVVEETRGETRLEQPPVEPLEREVAAERKLVPPERDSVRLDLRLERAQDPSVGVRDQLLARDTDLAETGGARHPRQLLRCERVDVDELLETLVPGRVGGRGPVPAG